ncbi:hypothetical protein COCON_G00073060, partial [Conger conger]
LLFSSPEPFIPFTPVAPLFPSPLPLLSCCFIDFCLWIPVYDPCLRLDSACFFWTLYLCPVFGLKKENHGGIW